MTRVTPAQQRMLDRIKRTGDDARAEGVNAGGCDCETCARTMTMCPATATDHVQSFASLWDEINGELAPWSSNPWVWRVEFRRLRHERTGDGS